jgi:hypothetical protein
LITFFRVKNICHYTLYLSPESGFRLERAAS